MTHAPSVRRPELEADVDFFVDDWEMPLAGILGERGFLDLWVSPASSMGPP